MKFHYHKPNPGAGTNNQEFDGPNINNQTHEAIAMKRGGEKYKMKGKQAVRAPKCHGYPTDSVGK